MTDGKITKPELSAMITTFHKEASVLVDKATMLDDIYPTAIYAIHKQLRHLDSIIIEIHRHIIHPDDETKPLLITQPMVAFECVRCERRVYIPKASYRNWDRVGPKCSWCSEVSRMSEIEFKRRDKYDEGLLMIVEMHGKNDVREE